MLLVLQIINSLISVEPPLIPNPSIKTQNSTFLLEWSPPFLWPGQHIDYFIIKVVILNDGSIAHYLVNTTFDDTIIPLTVELDTYDLRVCACTEFLFRISAIGPGQVELPSFNVTGRFLSCE